MSSIVPRKVDSVLFSEPQHGCSKAITAVSAGQDRIARAGAGLAIAATFAPSLLRDSARRRDMASIDFYLAAGASGDPTKLFETPDSAPSVTVMPAKRHMLNAKIDIVENLRYPSQYVPANPLTRDSYRAHQANGVAWAQHWRHGGEPRPTIIAGHGFTLSSWAFNGTFLAMQSFFERGYDVVLATSPFHGRRREPGDLFNGSGLFSNGMAHTLEAMAQGVFDIRSLVTHLLDSGVPKVGLTGLSLGGMFSALIAETDDRVEFVIPNAAPTQFGEMIHLWGPLGSRIERSLVDNGMSASTFADISAVFSPTTYPSLLPKERLMIIAGRGDRLVMPAHIEQLWEHWDRPELHWYTGNHVVHIGRAAYLRHMRSFIESTGFADGIGEAAMTGQEEDIA